MVFNLKRNSKPDNVERVGFKCVGCGACETICPQSCVSVAEVGRRGLRPIIKSSLCLQCGKCLVVCPLEDISCPESLNQVLAVFRGYSRDSKIYKNSSSGGVVSSVLYDLFFKDEIDGALVTFFDENLNLFGNFISSKDEVIDHSGSFYHSCKQLLRFKDIERFRSVAVVGLPCHIIAARRLVNILGYQKSVRLFISLFCSIGRMKKGIEEFLFFCKGVDLGEISVSRYKSRYGDQRLGIILMSTDKGDISFECNEYLSFGDYFYVPEGCYYCRRLYGLCADISVGDDWAITTANKVALVCANSSLGLQVLKENKFLELQEVGEKERIAVLVRSQPLGYPRKMGKQGGVNFILRIVKFVGRLNKSRNIFLRKVALKTRALVCMYLLSRFRREVDKLFLKL